MDDDGHDDDEGHNHGYGDNTHYANDDCVNNHYDGCDNVSYFARRVTYLLKQSKSFVA